MEFLKMRADGGIEIFSDAGELPPDAVELTSTQYDGLTNGTLVYYAGEIIDNPNPL